MAGILQDSYWFSNESRFEIENSLRFRGAQNLVRTPSVEGSRDTWTFSYWIKTGDINAIQPIFEVRIDQQNQSWFRFSSSNSSKLRWFNRVNNSEKGDVYTRALYRDPSAWYNVTGVADFGASTPTFTTYVNGVLQSMDATNSISSGESYINSTQPHQIGSGNTGPDYMIGYLSEISFVDGQALTASDFGEYNAEGIWVPKKYGGTYGTNGFYLDFADPNNIGKDRSGNGNDFTPSGFELTTPASTTYDLFTDTPTKNWPLFNAVTTPQSTAPASLFSANRIIQREGSATATRTTGFPISVGKLPTSGKHFFLVSTGPNSWTPSQDPSAALGLGLLSLPVDNVQSAAGSTWVLSSISGYGIQRNWQQSNNLISLGDGAGNIVTQTPPAPTGWQTNEINAMLCLAWNGDTRQAWFGHISRYPGESGYTGSISWFTEGGLINGSANPETNTGETSTIPLGVDNLFISTLTKQKASLVGRARLQPIAVYDTISYPASYKPVTSETLPAVTITDPSDHFSQVIAPVGNILTTAQALYTNSVIWVVSYNANEDGRITTSALGQTNMVRIPNGTSEQTWANPTLGTTAEAWVWNTPTSFTGTNAIDGYVNTTAGISTFKYQGTQSTQTIAHGLGVAPDMFFVTKLSGNNDDWATYFNTTAMGPRKYLTMSGAASANTDNNYWNQTSPTSTVITVGSAGATNGNSEFLCIAFASIPGFSSIGEYLGNNNSEGPFVYTGFSPAYVLVKNTKDDSTNWQCFDSLRNTNNPATLSVQTNRPDAQVSNTGPIDFTANGFKVRSTDGEVNGNNDAFVYMAFAKHPFGGSNVAPATAR